MCLKKILPFGFRHGSGAGWRYTWHLDEDPKDRFHFECRECLYWHIFHERNLMKLGAMFCHSDVSTLAAYPIRISSEPNPSAKAAIAAILISSAAKPTPGTAGKGAKAYEIAALMTIMILSPSAEEWWMKAARLTESFLSAF